MTRLWYVVDAITRARFEPGHTDQASALLELADRSTALDGDNPGRYEVEQQDVTPPARAVPMQQTNR